MCSLLEECSETLLAQEFAMGNESVKDVVRGFLLLAEEMSSISCQKTNHSAYHHHHHHHQDNRSEVL